MPFRKTGKILVAFDETDLATLRRLKAQGEANGCRGLELLDRAQLQAKLPQVGGHRRVLLPGDGDLRPLPVHRGPGRECRGQRGDLLPEPPCHRHRRGRWGVPGDRRGRRLLRPGGGERRRAVQRPGGRPGGGPGIPYLPLPGEYFILDQIAEGLLPLPVYPAPRAGEGGWGSTSPPPFTGTSSWAPAPSTSTPWRTLPPPSRCWTGCFRRPSSSSPA